MAGLSLVLTTSSPLLLRVATHLSPVSAIDRYFRRISYIYIYFSWMENEEYLERFVR